MRTGTKNKLNDGRRARDKKLFSVCVGDKGVGLIEVMIASVIFAFVMLSFSYMFALGRGIVGTGVDRRMALDFAQESMEFLKSRGFTWVEADVGAGGTGPYTWSGSSPSWTTTAATGSAKHQRTITVDYVSDTDYTVISTIGQTNSIRVVTTVAPALNRQSEFQQVELATVMTRR